MMLSDIPLLYEAGVQRRYDIVLTVTAPLWLRRRRALARPGMTEAKLDAILARQWPDAERCKHADGIITAGGGFAHTHRQVSDWMKRLRG
jgi:dephospho-CoA kinase